MERGPAANFDGFHWVRALVDVMAKSSPLESNPYHRSGEETDIVLEFLVTLTNQTGAEFPITLQVQGMLVTGILTSEQLYLEKSFISVAVNAESGSPLRNVSLNSAGPFKRTDRFPPDYIHLRNAHVVISKRDLAPGTPDGALWRGRLASVDAFFLGLLGRPSTV